MIELFIANFGQKLRAIEIMILQNFRFCSYFFPMKQQKYTLHLRSDGTINPGVLRIPHPDSILSVILPSGSPFHHPETILYSNIPTEDGKIQKVSRVAGPYSLLWDLQFDLLLTQPGPFYIYLQNGYNKSSSPQTYFTVDPVLHIRGSPVPISSFIIQTNFARCIGTIDNWCKNLRVLSQLGYNMIHLPPIQQIGSTSLYSISDFLTLSPSLFKYSVPESERWPLMKRVVAKIEDELGIVFMSDVVLNHINTNSQVLVKNPDLAYNVVNSPHLKPALFVDDLILQLSNDIVSGKTEINPKSPDCNLMSKILYERLVNSPFHNFYTLDKEECLKLFKSTSKVRSNENFNDLKNLTIDEKKKWFLDNCIVDDEKYEISKSISFIPEFAHGLFNNNEKDFLDAVDYANLPRYQHVDSIIHDIVENTINLFKSDYHEITQFRPIVWQYFSKFSKIPVACNGFLMVGKPTDDFMLPSSEAFVRRQVNIWGDCAKLRYGKSPEDNPALWRMMEQYITSCASISKALRIDNAHSTPLEVAEYMLRAARRVNPNIFVMAELFTDDYSGFDYINRIGINAFMKEGCYGRDVWSMNNLINSSGGRPLVPVDSMNYITEIMPESTIPGVVFDLTHDNMDINFDHGLISAGCSMAVAPSASTRGYDDILQWNPHCTQEFRLYPLSSSFPALHPLRQALNKLHFEMGILGMDEVQTFVHDSVLSIFRHNSETGDGRFMLLNFGDECRGKSILMPDGYSGFYFEAKVESVHYNSDKCTTQVIVPSDAKVYLNFKNPNKCHYDSRTNSIILDHFDNGSIVVFKTGLSKENKHSLELLTSDEIISRLIDGIHAESPDLLKLATLLFSCESEEQDVFHSGTYGFKNYQCFYAGIAGIKKAIDTSKDMGSCVFSNMKEGDWLIDFILNRMDKIGLVLLCEILDHFVSLAKQLPKMYRPRLISRIISGIDFVAKQYVISQFSEFVQRNNEFVQELSICSLQFLCPVPASPLLAKEIYQNLFYKEGLANEVKHPELSMAAGLPHFSTSWCRSWGRDTFISLRGLLLIPGRFDIAKSHLIAFASVERNGLIPNLMMGASNPRYNARDATWFFLQALQDYHSFISVKRNQQKKSSQNKNKSETDDLYDENIFDWIVPFQNGNDVIVKTMGEVVQEIMQSHANGIHFRDSAGDDCIKEEGRQIDIMTDWKTGLIYGGNQWNCGTWMDKMGSSFNAGNRGFPATPRNGAAVEINGLLGSTLKWLDNANNNNEFVFKGVAQITYHDWYQLLLKNFEKQFWIPEKSYYRDTVSSSNPQCDIQLRPNFVIPMAVCPELFENTENARKSLDIVSLKLLGKIGLRTLDPDDPNYRPNYHSSDQGDFLTADGFNYHNGPPWVWPVGYYCRAMLNFCRDKMFKVMEVISNLRLDLKENCASGIEELTYEDGVLCNDGCKTQAWSVATILDFLYDFNASFISH